jgi:hypothetical protein
MFVTFIREISLIRRLSVIHLLLYNEHQYSINIAINMQMCNSSVI